MKKVLSISLMLFMLVLITAACSSDSSSNTPSNSENNTDNQTETNDNANTNTDEPIKIGVLQPFSGPMSQPGQETARGTELAVAEQNAKGGLLGRKIELVTADTPNAQKAVSETERLITSENVDILTGTYLSSVAYPASQIANKYNTLYWETNALAPNLTEQGFKNFVRIGLNSDTVSNFAAESVKEAVAPTLDKSIEDLSVVIVHEHSIYGTAIGEGTEELLTGFGANVLDRIPYDPAAADLSDVVSLSKEQQPDVWLMAGYPNDGILLLRQARDLKWKPPVIMGVAIDSNYFSDALGAEGMEGILSVSFPLYDMSEEYAPGVEDFMELYESTYGHAPVLVQTLTSYGGAKILFEAIEKAGSLETEKIVEAALAMDVAEGGTYPTGFGVKLDPETLDNSRANPVLTQWVDGKLKTVYPEIAVKGDSKINLPLQGW